MDTDEACHLIDKIRSSEYILVVIGAGLSRPSGIPTFRNDSWFWERPIEYPASEAASKRDPLYVWAMYERLRLKVLDASPNAAHIALARLARAKPNLLTISQNIDDLCQRARHNDCQLVSLHGSLFKVRCENKLCAFEDWNYSPESAIPKLKALASSSKDLAAQSSSQNSVYMPSCPSCNSSRLRHGVCRFGEELPMHELGRVEKWLQSAAHVDLVLVIGTERTPFMQEAIAKGAEVAWLNIFDSNLIDTGDDWYVSGCASETLPRLVDAALR